MPSDLYDLSVVVPVFNEEPLNLRQLIVRLQQVLAQNEPNLKYEVLFVDDGSQAKTRNYLRELQQQNKEVKLVFLSRNFGEQAAIAAGLAHASGAVAVNMDSDLQDPPEMIPQMLTYWREGYDVVFTRQVHRHEPITKTLPAFLFYRILNRLSEITITPDAGEFRLLSRRVIDALEKMPEKTRFLRGLVPWVGFSSKEIPFEREERQAGETSYTLTKLVKLALDAIVSFSAVPLFAITWLGSIVLIAALAIGISFIANPFLLTQVSTTNILILSLLAVSGLQILALGIVAIYQAHLTTETRARPTYLVSDKWGFKESAKASGRFPTSLESASN